MSDRADDHCWLYAAGGMWAIRGIERFPDGRMRFLLWRGYVPKLEYAHVDFPSPDWQRRYARRAAEMLAEAFGS